MDVGADETWSKGGHADTEVSVVAVVELLCCATNDTLSARGGRIGIGGGFRRGCRGRTFDSRLTHSEDLNSLLGRRLDDLGDVDAGEVHIGRVNFAGFDNVLGLDNGVLCCAGKSRVEVARGHAEVAIAKGVNLVSLDEGDIAKNALFENVLLAVELADFLWLRVGYDLSASLVVAHRELAGLDPGAVTCTGVEGGDASTAGAAALCEGTLGRKLEVDLAGEVEVLKDIVAADIGRDHLLDLAGLEQFRKAGRGCSGIV